jgi:hypothetical protein
MISRRQTLGLFGAAATVGLLPGLRPARAAAATTFRIGWQKNGVLALAKRQGAIEKRLSDRGIKIEWSEFTSGPPLLEALGAGALDFGATGDVPPLFAQAAGGNLVYAGIYKGSPEASAILVRKNSSIQSLADLKGKKVAFKRGSSAHNVTVKALRKGGLTPADVDAIDLAPPDAAAAFKNGSIDAWSIWDPYLAIAAASSIPTASSWQTAISPRRIRRSSWTSSTNLPRSALLLRASSMRPSRRFPRSPASGKTSRGLRSRVPISASATSRPSPTVPSPISRHLLTSSTASASCRNS